MHAKHLIITLCIVMLVAVGSLFAEKLQYSNSQLPGTSLAQQGTAWTPDRTNFLVEDFSGTTFPPANWTVTEHPTNWTRAASAIAGGTAGECHFNYSPQFNGESRLVSPVINTTGQANLVLEFRQMLDWYATPFTIGVATRAANGTWHNVWTAQPATNIDAELKSITINNTDVGSDQFQFCIYFSGDSYNIDDWYIDNVRLFVPFAHDVKTNAIIANNQYTANTALVPTVQFANAGTNAETTPVTCKIYKYNTEVYSQTSTATLAVGGTQQVQFPSFTPDTANEMYKIVAYTTLTGDMDTANDTLSQWFNTYSEARQDVVVEIGTGTGCPYCPGAAMGADDLVENGQSVAVVEYHNYNANDPYNNTYAAARCAYYSITGYPTAVFDGVISHVGGSNNQSLYSTYLPSFNERNAVKSPFSIAVTGSVTGTTAHANVTITKAGRVVNPNLVLHFAVTESNIAYNWQGQTQLDFVERLMSPDASGTAIPTIVDQNSLTVPITFEVASTWALSNVELVAFIQDPSSREIYQGYKISYADFSGAPIFNAPTNLVATAGNSTVDLTWNAPATRALSGYKVYRNATFLANSTTTTYHDATVTNGTTYSYYVTATYTNPDGESNPSNTVSAAPVAPVLPAPTNLAATVTGHNVNLTWTDPNAGTYISYDGENNDGIGTGGAATFAVAARFTATELADYNGATLTKVKFFPREATATYTVKVWTGGSVSGTTYNPGTVAATQAVASITNEAWNEVNLATPVTINSAQELWIGYEVVTATGYPAGCDAGPQIEGKGNMMYFNNVWSTLSQISSSLTYNWNIKGFVQQAGSLKAVALPTTVVEAPAIVCNNVGTLQAGNLPSSKNQSTERPFVNYKVYRDGSFIANATATAYTDVNVVGGTHAYYVTAVYTNPDGESVPSNTVNVTVTATDDQNNVVTANRLMGNYPNPFNPETTISFNVVKDAPVSIDIYNIQGQKVKTLVNNVMTAGTHTVVWRGDNNEGNKVTSGVYFCKMNAGSYTEIKKMVMMK